VKSGIQNLARGFYMLEILFIGETLYLKWISFSYASAIYAICSRILLTCSSKSYSYLIFPGVVCELGSKLRTLCEGLWSWMPETFRL
jgi:hypothetical protein